MKSFLTTLFSIVCLAASAQFGTITNGDFEVWDSVEIYQNPAPWNSSNNVQYYGTPTVMPSTDAAVGTYSAHLEAASFGPLPLTSYVYHGTLGMSGFDGGIPYTDNIEAIQLQYKCELAPGDSLYLFVVRYNAGSIVGFNIFPFAYDTVSTWTPAVLYIGNVLSDELFIGISVGDITGATIPTPGSWARIDDIQTISGASPATPVPNNGFENWTGINVEEPNAWYTINDILSNSGAENVVKTSDASQGSYAAEMTTILSGSDTIAGFISKGPIDILSPTFTVGIPFTGSPLLFSGSYKYMPVSGDNATLYIEFFEAGSAVGGLYELLGAQATYTDFHYPVTLIGTPDSIVFMVYSGFVPGSKLYLDNLRFSGESIGLEETALEPFDVYPNPATDQLTVALPEGRYDLRVVSLTGKTLTSRTDVVGDQTIMLDNYAAGTYFLEIRGESGYQNAKFVVK